MNAFRNAVLGLGILISGPVMADQPLPQATNLWTYRFSTRIIDNITHSTPAVAPDGTIYVGAFDGHLIALTPAGKVQWQFQAGNEIKSSPAIGDDDAIYFGCRDNRIYAVTPEGKLKWKFATGAWVDSSPAIASDGAIYFGSWDKNFYALNADGSLKWKFAVAGIVDSSPALAVDGTIYFGAHNKKFYALDSAGKPRWTFLTGAEITSSPAIGDDGSVYFSSTDGNFYRLKSDGTEIWRCHIGGGSDGSPAIAENGNIFIAAGNQGLVISPAGAITWHWGAPLRIDETPAAAQGYVCTAAPWRRLWGEAPNGDLLWTAELTDNMVSSPVISNDGRIYFCMPRYVVAVQPPVTLRPAKSPWPMFRADARHTGRVAK